MSRKNRGGGLELGRAIMKDRNRGRRKKVDGAESWLHSSELSDGYDWNQLNLKSVTEESRLNEFLATAELAGTEFTAEKLNIRVIDPTPYTGLPTVSEREEMEQAQEEHLLSIPRRPCWDASTTAEQLELRERESFLTWRRNLAQIQEDDRLVLTPFERNLQFWRQLWRVVERSDIVVQIVDARNPLLFRCEDLEKYVCEVDPCKVNMLLVSKADLLTQEKRKEWSRYFTEHGGGITVAFWSALEEAEREKEIQDTLDQLSSVELETNGDAHPVDLHTREGVFAGDGREGEEEEEEEGEVKEEEEYEDEPKKLSLSAQTASEPDIHSSDHCDPSSVDISAAGIDPEGPIDANPAVSDTGDPSGPNAATSECSQTAAEVTLGTSAVRGEDTAITTDLLTSQELLDLFLAISPVQAGKLTTVGLVGYPNVGKSSTINTLFRGKKVPVSDTPGRTKHFQTLYVSDHLMLCDCPGLVFPSFVTSKAEMVCSGILPIDQMRDHIPPVSLVCHRIARPTLERTYGIQIAPPREGEDPTRPPYAHELLEAYGYMRGYMTAHGMPDCPRSARYILKDYVNGRLLYCHPPPGVEPKAFNSFPTQLLPEKHSNGGIERKEEGGDEEGGMEGKETSKSSLSEFDQGYFREEEVRAVSKGVHGTTGFVRKSGYSSHHAPLTSDLMKDESVPDSETASYVTSSSQPPQDKPWKKHFNRNKKQKTRRLVPYY